MITRLVFRISCAFFLDFNLSSLCSSDSSSSGLNIKATICFSTIGEFGVILLPIFSSWPFSTGKSVKILQYYRMIFAFSCDIMLRAYICPAVSIWQPMRIFPSPNLRCCALYDCWFSRSSCSTISASRSTWSAIRPSS